MAAHYLYTSNKVYFEILNEPHGINDVLWNTIQQDVITAIRKVDTKHTIVVGPASWNSYNNLKNMPVYTDDNLIYTFHFYDPFLFTHQGASWTDMTDLGGVPFPYAAGNMPAFPASLKGTWIEGAYNDYKNSGTVAEVHRLIDIAVTFQQQRKVPIFCGEFGVYDLKSPDPDRTYWYGVVREYLEAKNIAWTIWDYHGGFGLFNKGSNGMFYHDLNVAVCEQLGLTAPEQTLFIPKCDTVGFPIYVDFSGAGINNSVYTSGSANFYSEYRPNNGIYCIEWSNAAQYENITFNFSPVKDLTQLVENNYALDFFIRGTDPNGSIDVRFIDTDTGETDHPWRKRVTINNTKVDWSGSWEHLHIPLKTFAEQGAWENAWFNPENLFDWSAVNQFQIVAETKAMGKYTIWIDNIYITDQDTATVKYYEEPEDTTTNSIVGFRTSFFKISYSPTQQLLTLQNKTGSKVSFNLYHLSGKKVLSNDFIDHYQIDTRSLEKGVYIIQMKNDQNQSHIEKIILH